MYQSAMSRPFIVVMSVSALLAGCGKITPVAPDAAAGGSSDATPCAASLIDDELTCELAEGSFDGVVWAGDHLQLSPGRTSGTFTSRVFDLGAVSGDAAFSWMARAPYGKPLPDGGASETGYQEGGVDMSGNVLLLHLDQAELGNGRLVTDSSGRENHAVMVTGSEVARSEPGRFGSAVADSAASYFYVDLAKAGDLDFGTDDFTWALWVNTTEDCTGNKVHMGVEDTVAEGPHLWLGCGDASNSTCLDGEPGGRAAGTFQSIHQNRDGSGFCGVSRINDGAWHHVAVVKQGHPDSRLSLYVDGQLEHQAGLSFEAPLSFQGAPQFAMGAFSEGTYQAVGSFDEVAVWRRALGSAEVAALYRRGALRLRFQVRACEDAGCSGASSFVGPGASTTASFTDPAVALQPGASVSLRDVVRGQYLQYRATFESDVADSSPALESVAIIPAP